ncbi:hypothetical protein IFM51744_03776 [Aspergillus udagawae]|nr:hypothetical protein IFM51744_03776 [Aspergillus udagawae]
MMAQRRLLLLLVPGNACPQAFPRRLVPRQLLPLPHLQLPSSASPSRRGRVRAVLNSLPLMTAPRATSAAPDDSSSGTSPLRGGGSLSPVPPLGALPPLSSPPAGAEPVPSAPCQRRLKDALRQGQVCACVRDATYLKCKRCQRLKKKCLRVPLQVRRRAATWAATAPADRDSEGVKGFIAELEAITSYLEENEAVHVRRSLNRNVFRLLGVMSTMAGVPAPAPEEEEIEVEIFKGEVV